MDYVSYQHIPKNQRWLCGHLQFLKTIKIIPNHDFTKKKKFHWGSPMIALLLAFNWRKFGILNTTEGRFKKRLCDISRRSNVLSPASSSGNLFSWLFDKLRSVSMLNLTENFCGIFLITFELRSHEINSVFRIKW